MESSIKTSNAFAPLILLALFPFIQWGASNYLSFQVLCFIILLFIIDYKTAVLNLPAVIIIGLLMSVSTLTYIGSPYFIHSFLRVWREVLCLFALIAIRNTTYKYSVNENALINTIILLVAFLFLSTASQFISYNYFSSSIFFVPEYFYTGDFGTIADKWANFALEHSLNIKIRPSSFYAEPSYLGFIALSLLAIIIKMKSEKHLKLSLIGVLLLTLVISQTSSGILSFTIFFAAFYRKEIRLINPIYPISLVLLIPVYLIYFSLPDFAVRIFQINNSSTEISGFTRIILPFDFISKVWIYSPFGVPFNELFDFLRQPTVRMENNLFTTNFQSEFRLAGLDNAFLNFSIFYGILGPIILGIIAFKMHDSFVLFYLLLVSFFNGSILSFDKVAVISTTFIIINQFDKLSLNANTKRTMKMLDKSHDHPTKS